MPALHAATSRYREEERRLGPFEHCRTGGEQRCTGPERRYSQGIGDLPIRLLSDERFANAHRFHSYDDFEEIELHSTILIDKKGRVHWARNGGEPFSDNAFLIKQLERMNEAAMAE